jgi:hypothetical protein
MSMHMSLDAVEKGVQYERPANAYLAEKDNPFPVFDKYKVARERVQKPYNEQRPKTYKNPKRRRAKVRDGDPSYECAANVYLERKCPVKFRSLSRMRVHCRTFHLILEDKPAICECHLTAHKHSAESAKVYACRQSGYAHFFADMSEDGSDATWFPGCGQRGLRINGELSVRLSDVVNFIPIRRSSGKGPQWWHEDPEFRHYLDESTRLLLEELCGSRPVTMRVVMTGHTPTSVTPYLDPAIEQHVYAANYMQLPTRPRDGYAQSFTESVKAALSPGSGLDCIVSVGLDGFTCSTVRVKEYLRQNATPLALLILLHDTRELDDHGVGLVDGILPDGRSFILLHQDELLAHVPSLKVRPLFRAWDRKQAFKTTDDGEGTMNSTRNKY